MSVVVSYLKAVGHKAIILIMVLFGLEQASIVAAKFWLTKWTSDSELHHLTSLPADSEERYRSNVYYLGIYGCLGAAQGMSFINGCCIGFHSRFMTTMNPHYKGIH